MRVQRSILLGVTGAATISAFSVILRAIGIPLSLEMLLGTIGGLEPSATAFALGLAAHLALGGAFGLLYGWLMETVWDHGGAGTGAILSFIHASIVGMAVGLTPQFHPMVPSRMPDPGAFFSGVGAAGVFAFYGIHLLYGVIVGGGYGHVDAESHWAPSGRA